MAKTNRFIKFPIWLFEWEWADDADNVLAFLRLIDRANKTEKKWHGITVERGEIISSISGFAQICKLSEQKTRTFLKRCVDSNLIFKESTSTYTKIKIRNFDDFQGNVPKNSQHGKNEGFEENSEKINTVEFEKSTSHQHGQNQNISRNFSDSTAHINKPSTRFATNEQHTSNIRATTTKEYIKEYIKEDVEVEEAKNAPTPPTLEEVRKFCFERQSIIDPARFYNYYSKQGWNIGDWKVKVEEWENNKFSTSDRERVEKLANYRSFEGSNRGDINLDDFMENI